MILEVYDIETLSNLFTYTGYDVTNKSWYQFVICPWRDDTELLYNHLFRDKLIMVGYNNEGLIKINQAPINSDINSKSDELLGSLEPES